MSDFFQSMSCPICDEGFMEPFSNGTYSFRHGKKSYVVPHQHYAKCSACETLGYLPGQRRVNGDLIAQFQSKLTDYISPSDVLAVRERYSLTQKQATQIFRGGPTGISKWERGAAYPSAATAMLLKVALASPNAMREMAKIAGVDFLVDELNSDENNRRNADTANERIIVECTHSEYVEEITVAPDIEYANESENDDIWTTVKVQVQGQPFLN